MKELLEKYGFTYSGGCSCDGHTTHKYRKPDYELKHRVRQNRFRIKKNGAWLMQWTPIEQLETKLNEFTKENTVTS